VSGNPRGPPMRKHSAPEIWRDSFGLVASDYCCEIIRAVSTVRRRTNRQTTPDLDRSIGDTAICSKPFIWQDDCFMGIQSTAASEDIETDGVFGSRGSACNSSCQIVTRLQTTRAAGLVQIPFPSANVKSHGLGGFGWTTGYSYRGRLPDSSRQALYVLPTTHLVPQ
jgi:hypothetical protein